MNDRTKLITAGIIMATALSGSSNTPSKMAIAAKTAKRKRRQRMAKKSRAINRGKK